MISVDVTAEGAKAVPEVEVGPIGELFYDHKALNYRLFYKFVGPITLLWSRRGRGFLLRNERKFYKICCLTCQFFRAVRHPVWS